MPSFKERFRPSLKYKTSRDTNPSGTNDSPNAAAVSVASTASAHNSHVLKTDKTSAIVAAAASTTTAGKTVDEHAGSGTLATYNFPYSTDPLSN
ncbi:unnamed protein product [Rotaria magnacalcarata]|uniref:Uncharacterized protein n=2 Tax=Rotaria magnacalcarata TaxID=392030 RepID=A0A816CU99_9BILA|nr:unnamed protein product [Rotaria magnacalcarata]